MIHVRLASLNITIKFSSLFLLGLIFNEYISIKVTMYTKEKEKKKYIKHNQMCIRASSGLYYQIWSLFFFLYVTYFGYVSNSLFVLPLYFPCNLRKIKNQNQNTIRQHVKCKLMYTKTHEKHGCAGLKSIYRALFFLATYLWAIFPSFFYFVINSYIVVVFPCCYCWVYFPQR